MLCLHILGLSLFVLFNHFSPLSFWFYIYSYAWQSKLGPHGHTYTPRRAIQEFPTKSFFHRNRSNTRCIPLILILPIDVKRVPWKVGREEIDDILETREYFKRLSPKWKELTDIIRKDANAKLIIVNENHTLVYPP